MRRLRQSPRNFALGVAALATLGLGAAVTEASFSLDLSLEQLLELSPLVVQGRVSEVESRWNDDHSQIVTLAAIEVTEAFKGVGTGRLVVEVEGGRVGDDAIFVSGSPTFEPGEDVLVFLTAGGEGRFLVPQMDQGKLRIERDPQGRQWIGSADQLGALMPHKSIELDDQGRMAFDDFLAHLRPLARAQGGGSWIR